MAMLAAPVVTPMARPPCSNHKSAADACAAGSMVGIGGWLASSDAEVATNTFWYRLHFDCRDLPKSWECNRSHSETLLVIKFWHRGMLTARCLQGDCHQCRVLIPPSADNTATEAATNKLFTTAMPLRIFVQNLANWAVAMQVDAEINHMAGKENTLADGLSRGHQSVIDSFDPAREVDLSLDAILNGYITAQQHNRK
jgi:hypothetical protein